jgi:NO-binding membrane sensor protein with MHYT domain
MMFGGNVPGVTIVFVALAVVFAALAFQDFLREEGKLTPARKTWLRMALIFSAVSIGLFVWHTFFV